MSSNWTEEEKVEVVARYKEIMKNDFDTDEQRASNSTEVVTQLAEEFNKSPNGVRIILIKANAYIKKAPAVRTKTATAGGTKRVNKAEAQQELKNTIATIDVDLVDSEIIDKLTGKAAQYLTGVMHRLISQEE